MINNLYDMAVTEKDHATASMLKWFIDEQVEEEESATTIIDSLKLVSGDKMGVFMLDKEPGDSHLYAGSAPGRQGVIAFIPRKRGLLKIQRSSFL